jgi:hypothetical protein
MDNNIINSEKDIADSFNNYFSEIAVKLDSAGSGGVFVSMSLLQPNLVFSCSI